MDQAKIDEITGIAAFRKEYQEYIKAVDKWIENRNAVANINKANGYADTVPAIDFIVPPASISDSSLNERNSNISQEVAAYSYSTVVQKVVPKTPQILPDTEKMYYQKSKINTKILDRNGNAVDYFTDSFGPSTESYESPKVR